MPQIRVIVAVTAASVEAADEAIRQRVEICRQTEAEEEGCLQYEVYRSAMRPEKFALMELWASKELFDKHGFRDRPAPSAAPGAAPQSRTVEMYQVHLYTKLDGVWQALDPAERMETIRWI